MEDGCRRELTRSNSESSGVTVESSYQYPNGTLGQSAEWTNEKHNAYLGYLEASFVQQLHELHCSTGLQGLRSQEKTRGPYISQAPPAYTLSSPHQLMVLQDGSWQKVKLTEKESLFDSTADSHVSPESPWTHHFTSVGKPQTATSFDPQDHSVLCDEGFYLREDMSFSAESAGSSGRHQEYHLCHQNSVGSTTEVFDQNFMDGVQGRKTSRGSMARRLRTSAFDDQIPPRSDTHYFLRGS